MSRAKKIAAGVNEARRRAALVGDDANRARLLLWAELIPAIAEFDEKHRNEKGFAPNDYLSAFLGCAATLMTHAIFTITDCEPVTKAMLADLVKKNFSAALDEQPETIEMFAVLSGHDS